MYFRNLCTKYSHFPWMEVICSPVIRKGCEWGLYCIQPTGYIEQTKPLLSSPSFLSPSLPSPPLLSFPLLFPPLSFLLLLLPPFLPPFFLKQGKELLEYGVLLVSPRLNLGGCCTPNAERHVRTQVSIRYKMPIFQWLDFFPVSVSC